jgi:23S rRNA G2069 N7-methylase RlmK/C1962 C5-methylase RlmI
MIAQTLQFAYDWRKKLGFFERTEALRIFYGPGESRIPELNAVAIELFKNHAWITQWDSVAEKTLREITEFLKSLKVESVVLMDRSKVASDADVVTVWGTPPAERFSVNEFNVPYLIQFTETKHPGLFLDHAPLREWLLQTQKDKTVLNLFSYTGSLSVAAAHGGASKVTTLDLSKSTIEWAEENFKNAKIAPEKGNFIYGDALEWLPRLLKKGETFDTITCDPPSFSRSKNGTFSTQKDSQRLHELIFPVLNSGGILVTSINSENYPESHFLKDIHAAAEKTKCRIQILRRVDLPETFPTRSNQLQERYLKGFYILKY